MFPCGFVLEAAGEFARKNWCVGGGGVVQGHGEAAEQSSGHRQQSRAALAPRRWTGTAAASNSSNRGRRSGGAPPGAQPPAGRPGRISPCRRRRWSTRRQSCRRWAGSCWAHRGRPWRRLTPAPAAPVLRGPAWPCHPGCPAGRPASTQTQSWPVGVAPPPPPRRPAGAPQPAGAADIRQVTRPASRRRAVLRRPLAPRKRRACLPMYASTGTAISGSSIQLSRKRLIALNSRPVLMLKAKSRMAAALPSGVLKKAFTCRDHCGVRAAACSWQPLPAQPRNAPTPRCRGELTTGRFLSTSWLRSLALFLK